MRRRNWVGALGAVLVAPWLVAVPGAPASAVEPTCAGQPATIVGTDGSDMNLTGTEGPDVVSLGAGVDVFHGGGGDDVICGGDNGDSLYGDGGRDAIYGEGGDDHITTSFRSDCAGECGSDLALDGGTGDDQLWATEATEEGTALIGGSGRDVVMISSATGLIIDVPEGTVTGGAGPYTMDGLEIFDLNVSGGDDVFRGGPEDEEVHIDFGGQDRVSMGAGADLVYADGREGLQRVWLGPGNDRAFLQGRIRLLAGSGNDHLFPDGFGRGENPFSVRGGQGRDFLDFHYFRLHKQRRYAIGLDAGAGRARLPNGTVNRFAGFERYRGSEDADTLLGGAGRDWIDGWDGRDKIRGRAGNDVLIGGKDPDVIRGGAGRDLCDRGNTRGCERLR